MESLALAAAYIAGWAPGADAQEYGPHRTLLMIGGYGAAYRLDVGESQDGGERLGGGGRLMLNLAPLSGPGNTLMDLMVLGGFVSYGRGDEGSGLHSGAELDLHFVHNPLGGFLDPFLQLGAGRFRTRVEGEEDAARSEASFALSPGAGVRIARRGMVEMRADARDVIVFGSTGADGEERTTHNLELTAGLQLRF